MRRIAACLSVLLCATALGAADGSAPAVDPAVADDPKALLFFHLKQIADRGDLFDPGTVAPLAGMTFDVTSRDGPIETGCAAPYGLKSVRHVVATVVGDTWYRVLPSGAGSMAVPAFAINRATATGDATLRYRIDRYGQCRDPGESLVDSSEATLSFEGLPSYACITPRDLERLLPEAVSRQATDGVSLATYRGRVAREAGTVVEFVFRAGARCAVGVTVQQRQTWGRRYLAADDRYQTCRVRADRKYCASHPDVAWPDDEALKALAASTRATCGTLDSTFLRTTSDIDPPSPTRRWRNRSRPCGDGPVTPAAASPASPRIPSAAS